MRQLPTTYVVLYAMFVALISAAPFECAAGDVATPTYKPWYQQPLRTLFAPRPAPGALPQAVTGVAAPPLVDAKGNDLQCHAQRIILKMKSALSHKCEGPPADAAESQLACPDTDAKAAPADVTTNGVTTYDQVTRPVMTATTVDAAPTRTVDCSGLVSSLLAAFGWRMKPGTDGDWKQALDTKGLLEILDKGTPCWEKVPKGGGHQAGDIFVWNTGVSGHTGMYFDEKGDTFESTGSRTKDAGKGQGGFSGPGPEYKENRNNPVPDAQGANNKREGGEYRFTNAKDCQGTPKKIKGEEAIEHCPGVNN